MNELWAKLAERFPFLIDLLIKLKTFTLPGFEGIPVYDVYRFFISEIRANSLSIRSRAVAFSFFLAFFPALTFIFSLIPYIPYFNNLDVTIMKFLKEVLPNKETYAFIKSFTEPLLRDLAKNKRGGLLTGSIVLVIFLTSNGVMAMMSSFDKSYDHYKKRNALQGRMVALQITLLLMLLFIFSLGLVVLGQNLLSLLFSALAIKNVFTVFLLNLLRYALILLMFFLGISLIYYYGPATKKKYRFISTGATVATVLSILVSVGFSYWVSNFNKLNVIFGSIGTIMLLMIWLNLNSFVLLVGYEINASIYYNSNLRTRELEVKEV
ncbi:MAG: YihY/virulence factor BrkB family protein [Chitinophagales bacterium]|jgi:membrane protein|nr:YihY/virulence factor BrkB family protein [Chitinophagales bacterium]